MKRVSLSGEEKTIQAVWNWYQCQQKLSLIKKNHLLSEIRNNQAPTDPSFFGMTIEDINEFFYELEYLAMLDLLASAEATIKVDFLNRVYDRKKDNISRKFRDTYNEKKNNISLENDILDAWKELVPATKKEVSDFKGALNLRHWLAHGRYWTPKFGRNYSPDDIFDITHNLIGIIKK